MPSFPNFLRQIVIGATTTFLLAGSALAGDIKIMDPYARSGPQSGAVFMQIMNTGSLDDRLVSATSAVAKVTGLHTHIEDDDGVMKMREVEGGFEIPAGDTHILARGGDHVMLMGLSQKMAHGSSIELTLSFEKSGDITITVPVDLERKAKMHGHGTMDN